MDELELLLTIVALLAVVATATLAVFSPAFSDTAVQRVALAGIAISALGVAWWCWQSGQAPGPVFLLAVSCGLFAAETTRKIAAKRRAGTWREGT